jgi:uncharacterized protein YmfQ (DUF2313 family)
MASFLPRRTDDEQAKITADFLPNGRNWAWKRDTSSDGYKFLKGASKVFSRIESVINDFMAGLDITNNTSLLSRWEGAVRIPDSDFQTTGSDAMRQKHAITKMSSDGVLSRDEMKWLCGKMGMSVNVFTGMDFYTSGDPRAGAWLSKKQARFTIVIEYFPNESEFDGANVFPLSFPIQFTQNHFDVMQRYIDRVIPGNVRCRWIVTETETIINTSGADVIINTPGADVWTNS